MRRYSITLALLAVCLRLPAQVNNTVVKGNGTTVKVSLCETPCEINPMIYGQMLEDCNDGVIYGGIVSKEGKENPAVTQLLRPLRIPVMRWPGGTAIYDYEWRKGIGPVREAAPEGIWHGTEYYTFGTDEFLQWCANLGIEPYINVGMGHNNSFCQSLGDALDWMEYVNGDCSTPYGALRERNGRKDPYGVKYWCLGNENYLACKYHEVETAERYAAQLQQWSKTIKSLHPEVSLLGVGHTRDWNRTVIEKCGENVDILTLHFYLHSKIDGNLQLQKPDRTLFSSEMLDANLKNYINDAGGRVKFAVDEWNNRHKVLQDDGTFKLTRSDDRRQYDVPATASVLNVFIRNSPWVAMANYIFPVNGHGLVKTTGDSLAYRGLTYHVFDLYRKYMKGHVLPASVSGPGIKDAPLNEFSTLRGDVDKSTRDLVRDMCYIDAACAMDDEGVLNIALVSRSYDRTLTVGLELPEGYRAFEAWSVESGKVTDANTQYVQNGIKAGAVNKKGTGIKLSPCALVIVRCKKF